MFITAQKRAQNALLRATQPYLQHGSQNSPTAPDRSHTLTGHRARRPEPRRRCKTARQNCHSCHRLAGVVLLRGWAAGSAVGMYLFLLIPARIPGPYIVRGPHEHGDAGKIVGFHLALVITGSIRREPWVVFVDGFLDSNAIG